MNRERMLQVRQAILDNYENFSYRLTLSKRNTPARYLLDPECDTCGCVAGFACALFAPERIYGQAIIAKAGSELDLSRDEMDFLFQCMDTYRHEGAPIRSLNDGYEAAIERIDFLLEKHEALS